MNFPVTACTSNSYFVTSDHEIIQSYMNAPPGWILAEFPIEETKIPFNPITFLTDGRIEESCKNSQEAMKKAEKFLEELIASGHKPVKPTKQ